MLYVELREERRNIVMAWNLLPTDYTDRTWNGLQRFIEVDNGDGTVSFQDVTSYISKEKSFFGAYDANRMNEALNILMSMVENGTNLYEDFLNYFAAQKQLFENAASNDLSSFNTNLNNKQTTAQSNFDAFIAYMQEKEDGADTLMAAFLQYVNDFRAETATVIQEIKHDYESDMDDYKRNQQTYIDVWFQSVRDQLSDDVAFHLQNEIDDLKGSLIKIHVTVRAVMIGKVLTCTNGTVTESKTIDNTLECLFKFSEPGIYTLTDSFSGESQTIRAYHYGLYPATVNVSVVTVECPTVMSGKTVYLAYIGDNSEQEEPTKILSQTVDENGRAVFAVTDLGNWRVYNNYTEESITLNVEAYADYTVTMHIATLTVTFDEAYVGNVCTVVGNSGTIAKAIPAGGEVSFIIPLLGSVTISNNRTFDTANINMTEYTDYTAEFGIATVKLTFLKDAYVGHTITAVYGSNIITAEIDESKEVEFELKGLANWLISNTRNDKKILVNATEYTEYAYELDDFVYVGDCVGQYVNK